MPPTETKWARVNHWHHSPRNIHKAFTTRKRNCIFKLAATERPGQPKQTRPNLPISFALNNPLTRPIIRAIAYLYRAIYRLVIKVLAGIVTGILIDPGVKHAAATAVKDGMNMWLTQPKVKTKLLKLQQTLSAKDAENASQSLAKELGEDFPRALFNFLAGLILQGFDDDDDDEYSYAFNEEQPDNEERLS